jgi:NADPH-dependent curcumin reductase CurA
MATNRRIILASRPTGMVDDSVVRLEEADIPEPGPGEALLEVQWLSIDPTIRTWMNDAPGYLPPIGIGEVVRGGGIGKVTATKSDRFKVGDLVFGMTGWQEYAIADESANAMQILPEGVAPELALNVFGVTGMTAYFGLLDVGRLKEGDQVVVSGAAGATGSVVGQLAKAKGAAKVVGIAGSEQKCEWLVDGLGFDGAINYKTDDVPKALHGHFPQGIDLYFDNVGGEILDACLAQLAMRGRVVLCGAISSYNAEVPPPGPSNYRNLIVQRGRMEGFIILDYIDRFPEAQLEMFSLLAEGSLQHAEHVVEGLEHAHEALNLLFTGGNTGKVIVKV